MQLNNIYFYTASILNWIPLLAGEQFKQVVINSLAHLSNQGKIKVYGFVVMPNHIHLIWESLTLNGKEMPYASFMKFTGHQFLKMLRLDNDPILNQFKVGRNSRDHQFWQRNALPIELYSKKCIGTETRLYSLKPITGALEFS